MSFLLTGKLCFVYFQGMRDPLSDSVSKLALLRTHCKGITIREIAAGAFYKSDASGNLLLELYLSSVCYC